MADLDFVEIIPVSGAPLTISFATIPGGLSIKRDHISPRAPRRLQDGTLVTQALNYNKKNISITAGFWDIAIHTYLQSLRESGDVVTLNILYEDTSYAEQQEFSGSVNLVDYDDESDKQGNTKTINATFMEV